MRDEIQLVQNEYNNTISVQDTELFTLASYMKPVMESNDNTVFQFNTQTISLEIKTEYTTQILYFIYYDDPLTLFKTLINIFIAIKYILFTIIY